MTTENQDWITVDEMAKYLGVTRQTISNYINSGILPGRKIGGRYKVTREEFLKTINNKFSASTDDNKN